MLIHARRLAAVLVVVLALGAIVSDSASAAATTESAKWFVEGSELTGSQTVTGSLEGAVGVLETEVGETPLKLEWTEIECVSCAIFNEGGAKGEGKLKFTGVTVATPASCVVSGGAILTNQLKIDGTYMNGSTWAQQWLPATGTSIGTVTLQKGTKPCPIAGSYILSGSEFSAATNATGVNSTLQLFQFSLTNNSTLGGLIKFNSKPASLTFILKVSIAIPKLFNAH